MDVAYISSWEAGYYLQMGVSTRDWVGGLTEEKLACCAKLVMSVYNG